MSTLAVIRVPDNGRRGEGSGGNQPQAVAASPAGKRRTRQECPPMGSPTLRTHGPAECVSHAERGADRRATDTCRPRSAPGDQRRPLPPTDDVEAWTLDVLVAKTWSPGQGQPSGPAAPPSLGMRWVTPHPLLRVGAGMDGKHRTPRLGQRPSLEGGGVSAGPTAGPVRCHLRPRGGVSACRLQGKGFHGGWDLEVRALGPSLPGYVVHELWNLVATERG